MKNTLIPGALVVALLAGCAAPQKTSIVIPQAAGAYSVAASGHSHDDALRSALASAESTCKARNLRHIVSGQQSSYAGAVPEGVAGTVSTARTIIPFAGLIIPKVTTANDYQITLNFTCEI